MLLFTQFWVNHRDRDGPQSGADQPAPGRARISVRVRTIAAVESTTTLLTKRGRAIASIAGCEDGHVHGRVDAGDREHHGKPRRERAAGRRPAR